MRPEHLDLLHAVGRPSLTPDGQIAVVTVRRPDLAADAMTSSLWAIRTTASDGAGADVDSGDHAGPPATPAWQLTTGPGDSDPVVSPDGHRVAFLRSTRNGPPQIHLTGLFGGEPVPLTDHPLGTDAPRWSPDGTRLAYAARVPEPGRYGTALPDSEEGMGPPGPDAEAPRLITHPQYRLDDVGFIRDRRQHVFVLDVPAPPDAVAADLPPDPAEGRQLTAGDHDHEDPVWSPDGRRLALRSARHDTAETDARSGVHLVDVDREDPDPDPALLLGGDREVEGLAWLADGRVAVLAVDLGPTGRDFVGRQTHLLITSDPVGCDRTAEADVRLLTDPSSIDLVGDSDALVPAGGRLVTAEVHRGAIRLLAIDPDGPTVDGTDVAVLLDGAVEAHGHTASPDGRVLVAAVATPDRVADLAVVEAGQPRWLTDLSAPLRAEGGVHPLRELTATAPDGHPVHGWVVLPDPDRHGPGPHPVLLTIHGGPHGAYGWGLFDEAQVHAGAGRAVLLCNPRGSAGYGEAHGRAVRGALGTVDADDVLAFLDHALAAGELPLDPSRVGVQGGSYGGYLTALLTTRTRRFAAAVVERGYLDPESFVGSSDIGWIFPFEYHASPEGMAAQSPMRAVDRVTTPTQVIHSEHDWRCPVEQGQRWFAALRARDVEVELLLFPGEGHELSRSGRPRHRQQRFEHILRWWQRHLPV